jgi:hypothetical protein
MGEDKSNTQESKKNIEIVVVVPGENLLNMASEGNRFKKREKTEGASQLRSKFFLTCKLT